MRLRPLLRAMPFLVGGLLSACTSDTPLTTSNTNTPALTTSAPPVKNVLEITAESKRTANPSKDNERRRRCTEVCERTSALNCSSKPDCAAECAQESGDDPCSAALDAMMKCLVAQPLSNFECGPDGVAGVKEGHCDAEQEASIKCLMETAEYGAQQQ